MGQILTSRGCPELVPIYVAKMEAMHCMLGTRAYNGLISAHMRMNDHASAIDALDRLVSESKRVRKLVLVGGAESVFGQSAGSAPSAVATDVEDDQSNSLMFKATGGKLLTAIIHGDSYYTPPKDRIQRPSFGVNMFSFSALFMSGLLRRDFSRPIYRDNHSGKGSQQLSGQEACALAGKLFERMRKSGVVPDARLLFRIAQLADVGNDTLLMTKVLNLAHQNSHVSSDYSLFQPHTLTLETGARGSRTRKVDGRETAPPPTGSDQAVQDWHDLSTHVHPMGAQLLTHTDLAKLYRVAFDCARSAKRPGRCKAYLITMAESKIPLTPKMTEVAMKCFLEASENQNVVWVFESIPTWHGERTQVHAALLLQALAQMGRLSDAWRGLQEMKKDDPNGSLNPLLYSIVQFTLLKRLLLSFTERGQRSHRDQSVRKMTKATKLTATASLAIDILRSYEIYQQQQQEQQQQQQQQQQTDSRYVMCVFA